jgi:uncharacterized protein (TIGR02217 family)
MHVETRLSDEVENGAIRRDTMNLDIVRQDGGLEKRNRLWSQFLREYEISYPLDVRATSAVLAEVYAAYLATGGGEDSFDFEDWRDNTATDQLFGIGDASETVFNLFKTYTFGSRTHERRIYRPVSAISIKKEGLTVNPADYTVNYDMGIVTFDTAVPNGEEVTWSGSFYVPVRFEPTLQSVGVNAVHEKFDTFTLIEVRLRAEDFA